MGLTLRQLNRATLARQLLLRRERLARRYLEGFGPATPQDLAQFTLLKRSVASDALRAMADTLETVEGPDGVELFDIPPAQR